MDNLLTHPLLQDLTLERAVNYAVEFIRIVGMPQIYTDKEIQLNVTDYRTILPCDFVEINQIVNEAGHTYRHTTDTFHLTRNSDKHLTDLTYKLQNNVLYTNIKEDNIKVSYKSIEIDLDGFPLIPDNSSFIKSLELYIKKQWFTILFDLGKINQASYLNVQLEYAWYVGQALSDLARPSIDLMESLTNMWNLIVIKSNEHNKQFVHTGTKEYLKVH